MTRPLRSTSITPASSLLQGSPPLSGASVLSASRLETLAPFPLASPVRFSRSIQVDHRHCRPAANETMLGLRHAVGTEVVHWLGANKPALEMGTADGGTADKSVTVTDSR